MNKNTFKKIISAISAIAITVVLSTHVAHAQAASAVGQAALNLITGISIGPIMFIVDVISYFALTLAGWFLALCGTLLNVSMQLTTHLGQFIQASPIIYTVWSTIRDVSSMLLIFFILWAAIQMILGLERANFGGLLKSIVIAGILINFSFFFAQVLIDGSNIISLQFFNAMAPNANATYQPNDSLGTIISKTIKDGSGGLSGIFATNLAVNQWWSNKSGIQYITGLKDTNQQIAIATANYTGALVQFLAALSFLAAAAAAIWRTVILVFLLGFSSIWIAAYAVPQLKEFKTRWMSLFQTNLVFMPVYLAMMYVSVLIISKSGLNSLVAAVSTASTAGNSMTAYVGLFMGFAIILIFINIPLFAALSVSGMSKGFIKDISDWSIKFTKTATVGRVKDSSAWIGRNSLGLAANRAARSDTIKTLSTISPLAGRYVNKGLDKVSTATFGGTKGGYEGVLKQKKKENEAMHKRIGEVERADYDTKEEFDAAKDVAKARQKEFRASLTSTRGNIMSLMLDKRARAETAAKLNKDADDQRKKDLKKKNEPEIKKLKKQRDELEKLGPPLPGPAGAEIERRRNVTLDEINANIDKLEAEVEEAKALEGEEKDKKLEGKLDDLAKKVDKES